MKQTEHCCGCKFATPYAYPRYVQKFGLWISTGDYDVHCGCFDRRVTPVTACSKFLPLVEAAQSVSLGN